MAQNILGHRTVARTELLNLNITNFFGNQYNKFKGFSKAIKVFETCFLHYQSFNINIYQQKYQEYRDAMVDLYSLQNDNRVTNFSPFLNAIDQEVRDQQFSMTVGVTQIKTTEALINARVRVEFGHSNNQVLLQLDVSKEDQDTCKVAQSMEWTELNNAVQNDRQIVITYTDSSEPNVIRQYNPFLINYRGLHHEGFHHWLTFGTTKILFCIELYTEDWGYDEFEANDFHLNTIVFAVLKRVKHLRRQPTDQQLYRHTDSNVERKVTYDIEEVNPISSDAFWGDTPDVNQNRTTYCRVKYTDLQIGLQFGEELTQQKVCTCNQFCNMNAFFHYNPIYRFLLVEHNRHFIKNRTVIPNLYQLALTFNAIPGTPPLLTPVFDLLNSVSERVTENHLIFHKKPFLKTEWQNSTPNPIDMEGYVYLCLFKMDLKQIMHVNYGQVNFDENAFINIEKIMDRLYELHRRIELCPKFVDDNDRKQWVREFEYRGRSHYFSYLNASFELTLNDVNTTYEENLFTPDYEVRAVAITNAQKGQYYRWRIIEHNSFAQNLKFVIPCFTYAMNQLWLSLTRFHPMSGIYAATALEEQYDSLQTVNDNIENTIQIPQPLGYRIRLKTVSQQSLSGQNFSQNTQLLFTQFYKLKVYSRVFTIQNKFMDSLYRYTRSQGLQLQGFAVFQAIWDYSWIEDISVPTTPIFQRNDAFLTLITEFYNNFWLRPAHDIPAQQVSEQLLRDSIFDEYAKRRHWDRIDGDNRKLFNDILESFDKSIHSLLIQSQDFIDNSITPALTEIRAYYRDRETASEEDDKKYCYILDVVMYWLFRATLYQITGVVTELLQAIDLLQSPNLLTQNTQYMLSKPGLAKLFLTRDKVFQRVDQLFLLFVVYSSPFDNMSEPIRQTKYNIKILYSELFRMLIENWFTELQYFFNYTSITWFPMIKLHVIAGSSFIISYVNHNRKGVHRIRKKLIRLTRDPQYVGFTTHIPFRQMWNSCLQWFRNLNRTDMGRPFVAIRFGAHLMNEFRRMDAKDLSYLTNRAGIPIQPTP